MPLLQLVGKVEVALGILFHAGKEGSLCFRDRLDLRGCHKAEVIQPDIALALHAEGRDAMPGDLGKQCAADPLDAKSKAGVLDGAGVTEVAEHGQEFCSFFRVQSVQQVGDVGIGIAEFCGSSHNFFRLRGVGDQTNSHHRVILPP